MTNIKSEIKVDERISLEAEIATGNGKIAYIVAHPHPKLGGSLHDGVVSNVFTGLKDHSSCHSILRFNFRSVGRSTGSCSWTGWSERDDIRAVVNYIMVEFPEKQSITPPTSLIIIGYSFGSAVGCGVASEFDKCLGTVAISYPSGWMSSILFYSHYPYLKQCSLPKLLLMGDKDNFTSVSGFNSFCSKTKDPKTSIIVPNQDHFWRTGTKILVEHITKWVESEFQE